ncbi:MAG: glycosyltransferase [bacterium]|nr:glycosyltransferase [bacterium]
MPEVSIIVAAYNGERFIKEALESLLSQTFSDFEIVVVDDGSTDSTAEIVKSFEDERIRYFYKENSGNQAIPRNYGIKKAQGEYIALCDQDDLWYPEKLEKQLGNKPGKNVGIIVTSADIVDEKGKRVGVRYVPEGYMDSAESFEMLLDEDFITSCSAIIPRKILDEVGLLDEKLRGNDDYDMWLRITKKYGVYGISESLCAWRRSEKAFSHDMSRIFLENEKIFKTLKANNKAAEELIEKGKNKNLVRLFVAYVKEKKYDEAKQVLPKIKPFEGLRKVKIVIKIFKVSPSMARTALIAVGQLKNKS